MSDEPDNRPPSQRLIDKMKNYRLWETAQPFVIEAFETYERQIADLQARVADLEQERRR